MAVVPDKVASRAEERSQRLQVPGDAVGERRHLVSESEETPEAAEIDWGGEVPYSVRECGIGPVAVLRYEKAGEPHTWQEELDLVAVQGDAVLTAALKEEAHALEELVTGPAVDDNVIHEALHPVEILEALVHAAVIVLAD